MSPCSVAWLLPPWAQLYSALPCGGREAAVVPCPGAAPVVAGSSLTVRADSAEAQFMPALHQCAPASGERALAAGAGAVLAIPGAGDIPGPTDMAGIRIRGGDGRDLSATATHIQPKILPMFMVIPRSRALTLKAARFSRMRSIV